MAEIQQFKRNFSVSTKTKSHKILRGSELLGDQAIYFTARLLSLSFDYIGNETSKKWKEFEIEVFLFAWSQWKSLNQRRNFVLIVLLKMILSTIQGRFSGSHWLAANDTCEIKVTFARPFKIDLEHGEIRGYKNPWQRSWRESSSCDRERR